MRSESEKRKPTRWRNHLKFETFTLEIRYMISLYFPWITLNFLLVLYKRLMMCAKFNKGVLMGYFYLHFGPSWLIPGLYCRTFTMKQLSSMSFNISGVEITARLGHKGWGHAFLRFHIPEIPAIALVNGWKPSREE